MEDILQETTNLLPRKSVEIRYFDPGIFFLSPWLGGRVGKYVLLLGPSEYLTPSIMTYLAVNMEFNGRDVIKLPSRYLVDISDFSMFKYINVEDLESLEGKLIWKGTLNPTYYKQLEDKADVYIKNTFLSRK